VAIVVRNHKTTIGIAFIYFLIAAYIPCHGQQGAINLQKQVTISSNNIQLDSLLYFIKKQTGAKFSLNTRKLPASKLMRIKVRKQSIEGFLREIKQNTGVYYTVLGDHIILLDNPPPAAASTINTSQKTPSSQKQLPLRGKGTTAKTAVPSKVTNNAPIKHTTNTIHERTSPLNNFSPLPVNTTPSNTTILSHKISVGDTMPIASVIYLQKHFLSSKPVTAEPAANNIKSSSSKRNKKEWPAFTNNLFLKAGIATDDIFRLGPTIQAGLPNVYGIASWNTNFKVSGFRYGAGISIPLKEQWQLHFQFTTGNLPSSKDSTKQDTVKRYWQAKTQLHRGALLAEASLGNRFTIQLGPVLNIMKLNFYLNGEQTRPGLSESSANKNFKLIDPVYTITNNYSPASPKSTKIWVGLQVSIFYNFLTKRP
jgi:hypothetical protein